MRVFIIVVLLAVTFNQVFSNPLHCNAAVVSCTFQHTDIVTSTTCDEKAPYFTCLREHCSVDDALYKAQSLMYNYQTCDCPAPPSISNAEAIVSETAFGATVTYTCNKGYTQSGGAEITCGADGSWTGASFVCTIIDCLAPSSISNTKSIYRHTTFGKTATYKCNEGYTQSGKAEVTCGADGSWTEATIACTIYSDEKKCFMAVRTCAEKHKDIITNIKDKTCEQKAPLFKCLRDNHCSEDDNNYKEQVKRYKYESCGASGASATIMGWTLPILMLSLAKYFSK